MKVQLTESQATMKDRNVSYYTGDAGVNELQDFLSCHHRTDGNGVHMPVSDISKRKAEKVLWEDQVLAFNTW